MAEWGYCAKEHIAIRNADTSPVEFPEQFDKGRKGMIRQAFRKFLFPDTAKANAARIARGEQPVPSVAVHPLFEPDTGPKGSTKGRRPETSQEPRSKSARRQHDSPNPGGASSVASQPPNRGTSTEPTRHQPQDGKGKSKGKGGKSKQKDKRSRPYSTDARPEVVAPPTSAQQEEQGGEPKKRRGTRSGKAVKALKAQTQGRGPRPPPSGGSGASTGEFRC